MQRSSSVLTALCRCVVVAATALGVTSCIDLLFPADVYAGPPLPEARRIGRVNQQLQSNDCPEGSRVYSSIDVIFENLGACEQRQVDLDAILAPWMPYDPTFDSGLLPDRVPATGSDLRVSFTAAELFAASGGQRPEQIVVTLRCSGVVTDRSVIELGVATAVGNVTRATGVEDRWSEIIGLRDDGGAIVVSTPERSISSNATAMVPLSLEAVGPDGSLTAHVDTVVTVSAARLWNSLHQQVHGPAIEALGNDRYFVRILDDVATPHAAWAALVDGDGTLVGAWSDKAVLQAERIGERLVLIRAPLAADDVPGAVVVDVVDATTGTAIVSNLQTPWRADDFLNVERTMFVAAADDVGVDVVRSDEADLYVATGEETPWRYVQLRRGAAPVSVRVMLSAAADPEGLGIARVAALPGAVDGRFIVFAGRGDTRVLITALDADGASFRTVEDVGTFGGGIAYTLTTSRHRDALAVSLTGGWAGSTGIAGQYLYFRDGAFVCAMRSMNEGAPLTVTSDAFVLVDGELHTSCTEERVLSVGLGGHAVQTDSGFRQVVRSIDAFWIVESVPVEELLAVAPLSTAVFGNR